MPIGDKRSLSRTYRLRIVLALLLIICAALRLVALSADPPSFLDWSTGLQTDEGFYTLDGRHMALFGSWAPGNFHDRLLSPLLSELQQYVFHIFNIGTMQARLISVTFGLATIIVFWWGLRAAYGERTALAGAALLGLAPPVVFFNRMALQETPAVFWLALAFALWTNAKKRDRTVAWCAGAGVALAVAAIFKALAVVAIPAFAIASWRDGRRAIWLIASFVGAMCFYGALWYAPHHVEIARMAGYYRAHQIAPHSALGLWLNVRRSVIDPVRGVAPYLLWLMPIPCLLVLRFAFGGKREPTDIFFSAWLIVGLAFCAASSYAPDRYLMVFLPALAGLAARGLSRLRSPTQYAAIGLFLASSGLWYGQAWEHRSYDRQAASRLLANALPAHSMVIGEMAPALCLDTPFAAVPVQPGLSNDIDPVARLRATAVIVTRTPFWEEWWKSRYPEIVQPSHRVATLALGGRWRRVADVYKVQE